MAKYAVFQNGSKQYKVFEGEELLLDKLKADKDTFEFANVVLVANDGKISLGNPFVKGASVQARILREEKGEKIHVVKYKAKSRYRKTIGHRSQLTRVKVEKIIS